MALADAGPEMAALWVQVGVVKTWSAYHTYMEQHPQKDPIPAFKRDLLKALGAQVSDIATAPDA